MVNVSGRTQRRDREEPRKRGFVYRKRSSEDVKKRAQRQGGRFDSPFKSGLDIWRPKQGDNLIRILPANDAAHYGYEIWVHAYIGDGSGTYLCPLKMKKKPCPICHEAKRARDAGDEEEAKDLQAVEKYVAWIIDRDDKDETPQLWMMSWTMDRDLAALTIDTRTGKTILVDDPEEGFDLTIKRSGTTKTNTKYFGLAFARDPQPISDDDKDQERILDFIVDNPIPEILHYHSAEHMEAALSGIAEKSDEDLDEEEDQEGDGRDREAEEEQEEREARSTKSTKRVRRTRDEEEEEERAPRRAARREEPEDEDEDEDYEDETDEGEEEEEEEEVETRRRPRRAAREEEEEAPPRRAGRERLQQRLANNGRGRRRDADEETETRRSTRRPAREERTRRESRR